jgi:glycerophosphoryl diester phosphodiesterase
MPLARSQRTRTLGIAHRGASAYAPENSGAAFAAAATMGADMIEVDVRLTRDGVPVVIHDESLKRTYGIDRTVASLSLDELRALVELAKHEPVPTFTQVAHMCADLGLGLYVDLKALDSISGLSIIHSIEKYGMLDYSIVGAFHPDWVAEIKRFEPRVKTSILFGSTSVDPVLLAQAVHCDYVHPCWENAAQKPHTLLTPAWLERVHKANLGVVCWHEERPDEIAALSQLGVDAICSDAPDVLMSILKNSELSA